MALYGMEYYYKLSEDKHFGNKTKIRQKKDFNKKRWQKTSTFTTKKSKSFHFLAKKWVAYQVCASSKTVTRRLKEIDIYFYSATKKPHLTSKQIKERYMFCKLQEKWTVEDWNTAIFSDECIIRAGQEGGWQFRYRKSNEKLKKSSIVDRKHFSKSIMIWGCISTFGIRELEVIKGSMDVRVYVYLEVLKKNLEHMKKIIPAIRR